MTSGKMLAPNLGPEEPGSPVVLHKRTYTLQYEDDALGLPKRIDFEAENAAIVLEIAEGEADGRQAVLLVDGQPLCLLAKAPAEHGPYWIIREQMAAGSSRSDAPSPP